MESWESSVYWTVEKQRNLLLPQSTDACHMAALKAANDTENHYVTTDGAITAWLCSDNYPWWYSYRLTLLWHPPLKLLLQSDIVLTPTAHYYRLTLLWQLPLMILLQADIALTATPDDTTTGWHCTDTYPFMLLLQTATDIPKQLKRMIALEFILVHLQDALNFKQFHLI